MKTKLLRKARSIYSVEHDHQRDGKILYRVVEYSGGIKVPMTEWAQRYKISKDLMNVFILRWSRKNSHKIL